MFLELFVTIRTSGTCSKMLRVLQKQSFETLFLFLSFQSLLSSCCIFVNCCNLKLLMLRWMFSCRALEGLVNVDAAEAGMPRVLFAAVELMLTRFGTDNELVLASR